MLPTENKIVVQLSSFYGNTYRDHALPSRDTSSVDEAAETGISMATTIFTKHYLPFTIRT
jgi:hypothetical protein